MAISSQFKHLTRRLWSILRAHARILLIVGISTAAATQEQAQEQAQAQAQAQATTLIADKTYQGFERDGIATFLGLPYARAGRWQSPSLIPKSVAEQSASATQYGPACSQTPHIINWYRGVINDFGGNPDSFPAPAFSEDCLSLNIWAPANPKTKAPVVVYIHGGSNKGGWSYEPNYVGHSLAKKGIIVVSINYRLGVLGFFAHPHIPDPNFALLDQIAALQWVHKYLGQIGADTNNVAIMGESAGANNINFLITSPSARGLFTKAIHQSAGWAINGRVELAASKTLASKLTEAVTGSADDLQSLQAHPVSDVLQTASPSSQDHYFDPIPGTPRLPAPALDVFEAGAFNKVDLLIGSNADEWLMYLSDDQTLSATIAELVPKQNRDAVASLLAKKTEQDALDSLITAHNYVCPSFNIARYVRHTGARAWMYYFTRVRDGELANKMGAYHGAELPYVFGTHDEWLPTSQVDLELSEQMMSYWANFIRTGNPNSPGLPDWPAFDMNHSTAILNLPYRAGVHPEARLCALLSEQ
jgi:para-nitrobenzyl esterase